MKIDKATASARKLINLKIPSASEFLENAEPFSAIEDLKREFELISILRFSDSRDNSLILQLGYSQDEIRKGYRKLERESQESSDLREARDWSELSGRVVGAEDFNWS